MGRMGKGKPDSERRHQTGGGGLLLDVLSSSGFLILLQSVENAKYTFNLLRIKLIFRRWLTYLGAMYG